MAHLKSGKHTFYNWNPDDSEQAKRYKAILDSLKQQGITQDQIQVRTDKNNTLVLQYSATNWTAPRRKRSVSKPSILPPMLTAEQCRNKLAQAKKALDNFRQVLRARLHAQWAIISDGRVNYYRIYRHELRQKQQVIGHAIAQVIARHGGKRYSPSSSSYGTSRYGRTHRPSYSKQDYALLDAACGHRVKRASQLPKYYSDVLEYVARSEARAVRWERTNPTEDKDREAPVPAMQEFLTLKLDIEYWSEMVRLTATDEGQIAA